MNKLDALCFAIDQISEQLCSAEDDIFIKRATLAMIRLQSMHDALIKAKSRRSLKTQNRNSLGRV